MGGDNSKQLAREKDMAERKARQEAERKRIEDEEKDRRRRDIETTKKQFILNLQASSRGYLARENCAKLRQLNGMRIKIANEILSTEKSYSASLKVCIDVFFDPLMAAALAEESKMTRDFKKQQQKSSPKSQDSVKTKDTIENYYKHGRTSSVESPTKHDELQRRPTVSSLKTSDYYASMQNVPEIPGLTREDVKMVFNILETIYVFSQKMMEALEQCLKHKLMTERIGEQFLEMSDLFKGYIQYVNNYNSAMERLEKLTTTNTHFKAFLEETYLKPVCNNNTLTSYLIMPIQRIPRYQMLLQDLSKHCPEGMNKEKLDLALKKIVEVANTINEKKRESENFVSIVSVYNKLEPKIENLCAAHRRFIYQGNLKEEGDEFLCILFNDLLLKVKESKNGTVLKLSAQVFLKNATCVDLQDDPTKKIKKMFKLEMPTKTLVFKAKTEEEKQKWMQLIRASIDEQVTKSQSYSHASAKIHSVQ